ncbi:hypothetical protein R1flu_011822 [Riccia fluitans]|uniref:RanBP2-type domain-containing protein n=1 Tax=Riccia fluitans TaxID=41844 RepID=A0ABD1Z8V0_9MARC
MDDDDCNFSPEALDAIEKSFATPLAAQKHMPSFTLSALSWDSPSTRVLPHNYSESCTVKCIVVGSNPGPLRMVTGFVKIQVVPTLTTHVGRSVINVEKARGYWGCSGEGLHRQYKDSPWRTGSISSDGEVPGVHERLGMARGMTSHNGSDVSLQQPGISISPGSSNLVGELEPWIGGGYDQPVPSFASHYVTGDGGLSGRRSTLSAATEGKRLAEQLVASFAASSDPVGDAGECLASAALWLQTMKSRMQAGDSGALSTSSLVSSFMMGDSNSFVLGGSLVGMDGGRANLPNGNIPLGPRPVVPRTLLYEDYKDRPSDYLREFGDPAAVSATAMGGGLRPEPGVYGNWECEECKNVNFPRRTNCFQCHKRRGLKGEEIVRKYVRGLIEEANRL